MASENHNSGPIVPLADVLLSHDVPLLHPELHVLKANQAEYTTLLLQPEANIRITAESIAHADSGRANALVGGFLKMAVEPEHQVDLLVCPEYSVPWETLIALVEAGVVPSDGRLWVLGCESLPLNRLHEYRQRLQGKAIVIDEKPDFSKATTQRYLDPVVYLFRTKERDTDTKHVVLLVQYKTQPSGDPQNTEAVGMLPGSKIYLFGRTPKEVRLITLICSDVLNAPNFDDYYNGLLVVHIQLNNDPRNPAYKPYREALFRYRQDTTELVCLNWAANITFHLPNGHSHNCQNIGGSGWYLKSTEFDESDDRLKANHRAGLYYNWYDAIHAHALMFHYAPRAFYLQSSKVFHHAVTGPASYRRGPEVLATYDWDTNTGTWITSPAPPADGFAELIAASSNGVDLASIVAMYEAEPLDVERMLSISAGTLGPSDTWWAVRRLDSTQMCQEEIMWRTTVAIDPKSNDFRSNRLAAARALLALKEHGFDWPQEVAFLSTGFRFRWSKEHPVRNVESLEENPTLATVIYAGPLGDKRVLETIDQKARSLLARPPEPEHPLSPEALREYRREFEARVPRLCILYVDGPNTVPYRNRDFLSINRPSSMGANNFAASAPPPRQ